VDAIDADYIVADMQDEMHAIVKQYMRAESIEAEVESEELEPE
jgi:hypothetical protein